MATYRGLNPIEVKSAPDQTGKNAGNLTAAFPSSQMPTVNAYEIYHMMVTGGPPLAFATIKRGPRSWSYVVLDVNGGNEWDPSAPLLMTKDMELYFYWNIANGSTKPPVVTLWPRYDIDLPENAIARSTLQA